jgi:DNA-binding NtrC family response regulator
MSLETTVARPTAQVVRGGTVRVEGSGKTIEVGEEPLLIGRDAACHVVVSDSEVSAVHLEVSRAEQGLRLRDLGSKNGTLIGGIRIGEAVVVSPQRLALGSSFIEVMPGPERHIETTATSAFGPLVGASDKMRALFDRLAKAAATELTVLVLGETGTGKELVARAVHDASPRKHGPFVVVDCAAIPRTLGEATLLGHERGAFTGADRARQSPFVPNLLRVIAERRVKPVGGSRFTDIDVRIVAATRQNLLAAVNEGTFRSDLYFRLAQVRVEVPPLRARSEDIPLILDRVLSDLGDPAAIERVPTESLERLMQHDFPGNVRELKNAATVAHALSGDGPIDVASYVQEALAELGGSGMLPVPSETGGAVVPYHSAKRQALDEFERRYFEHLAEIIPDNVSEMSRVSGLSRLHVRKHLQRHGILLVRPGQQRSE